MTNPCTFCGQEATRTDLDYCRDCYYQGKHLERTWGALFEALRDLENVCTVTAIHSGGGCWLLGVTLTDFRFLALTDGIEDKETGTFYGEADFPPTSDPDPKWYMSISKDEDAFWAQDEFPRIYPTLIKTADIAEAVKSL